MPDVTIKLKNADDMKSFVIDCDLDLYPGKPLSPAEVAAAEIMRRTKGVWNITASNKPAATSKPVHDVATCQCAICEGRRFGIGVAP